MGFGCHTQNSRDPSKKRLSSILKLGLICEIIFCLLTCYGDLDVMLQAVEFQAPKDIHTCSSIPKLGFIFEFFNKSDFNCYW